MIDFPELLWLSQLYEESIESTAGHKKEKKKYTLVVNLEDRDQKASYKSLILVYTDFFIESDLNWQFSGLSAVLLR